MSVSKYQELGKELVKRGYQRRYVNQLLDELDDHHAELVGEYLDTGFTLDQAKNFANQQIGSKEILLQQVLAQKDLIPLVKRRPILIFFIAPVILFILSVMLILVAPISVLSSIYSDMTGRQIFESGLVDMLIILTDIAAYAVAPLLALFFAYLADKYAVGLRWLATACALVALIGSTMVFTVIYPQEMTGTPLNPSSTMGTDEDIPTDGGLILDGGFWSDYGPNYASFLLPIFLFCFYAAYRHRHRLARK